MPVKWTVDQELAIKTADRGVIVSAAAGSGKTAVLIERIIRLLSDEKKKIPADRLLAVTFTNDAAAQMRDKLNAAFEKKLKLEPNNAWLLSQQNLLQMAKISTINSFCLELVKENLHLFNFQGGLKILDEPFQKQILEQSRNQALNELCENDPEKYEELYNAFSLKSGTLESIIDSLYGFLRSLAFPDKWIKESCEIYTDKDKTEKIVDSLFYKAEARLNAAEKNLEMLRTAYRYSVSAGDREYSFAQCQKKLEEVIAAHNENASVFKKALSEKNFKVLTEYTPAYAKMPGVLTGKKDLPEDIAGIFNDLKAETKKLNEKIKAEFTAISELFVLPEERIKANFTEVNEIFRILCSVVKRTEEIALETKIEKNSVDFSDVELMAKQLLIEETENGYKRTELAEEIRSSRMYEIIMIDEFQDVNNLQELIFRSISDSEDVRIMGRNIFAVGDIKQAIYRFRLTNPELFADCLKSAEDVKNNGLLKAIYLQKNFRSRKEVIDFVNFMFGSLMSVKAGAVTYNEKEKLEYGAEYSSRPVPAEIMMITCHDDFDKSCGYSEENLLVARRIKQMLDEKVQVFENGKDRNCRPSDFCILVQVNAEGRRMAKALETVGLHAYSEDTDGYINSREIAIILDFLRVIDNPMNDIALAGVMMSPVMNFTPDDMAVIREKGREKNSYENHLFQILTASDHDKKNTHEKASEYIDFGSESLQQKCENAYRLIDSLRYYSMSMNLERLIRKIFELTDLMGLTALYLDSNKKRANLRLLLEYASQYEQASCEGVSGFLRYIDSVASNEKAFKQAVTVTSAGESVFVKTYHASKGLEYPFVFICQLWKDMCGVQDKICLHNTKGYAFQYADASKLIERKNIYFDILSREISDEEKSEKMRLLYVACTRAREKLFISYTVKVDGKRKFENGMAEQRRIAASIEDTEKISAETVLEQKDMLSWITLGLMKYPNNSSFTEWLGVKSGKTAADKSIKQDIIDFVAMELENKDGQNTESKTVFSPPDSKIISSLFEKYSFEYDKTLSRMPSKLAVTEIVKEEMERAFKDKNPEFYPSLPRLDDELDKLTNAERGTFTHKFMELADYENAEIDVAGELERLRRQGYFTEKEASGVYIKSLEIFFSSDFYKRMKSSEEIMREKKFLVSMKDLKLDGALAGVTGDDGMIQGIADCIFKEGDGYVIVDYKTDRFKSRMDMFKYDAQLRIYKAAFELILDRKIKSCYIYSFWLGEGTEINL